MGTLDDIFSDSEGKFDADILGLGGREGANAAIRAAEILAESGAEAIDIEQTARAKAQEFFKPFAGAAEAGLKGAGFLTDPQAQFDFLQNNPLFKAALENANTQTQQSAAARGRLSAGDTLQQLSKNTLLAATPILDRQIAGVNRMLNLGTGIAAAQANITIGEAANVGGLTTDIGSAQAAGQVGAAQAQQQGNQNLLQLAGTAAAIFSDRRLKENITFKYVENGYPVYNWTWNSLANELFSLVGSAFGVMADEIQKIIPEAITLNQGYMMVDYEMIGVTKWH